jgi:hypothetical protein
MSIHESVSVAAVRVAPAVTPLERRKPTSRGVPFLVAAVAFAAVMITHLVNFGADDLRVRLLNANSDASWSHVLIAATLVGGTGVAALGVWRADREANLWRASAAILAFLSISEISSLHAKIDQLSWGKVVYAPILLALCVCLWRVSQRSRFRLAVRAALATLVVSFAIHVLGPHVVHALGYGYNSWAYQVKVGLKQATELVGWLLVLLGLGRVVLSRTG